MSDQLNALKTSIETYYAEFGRDISRVISAELVEKGGFEVLLPKLGLADPIDVSARYAVLLDYLRTKGTGLFLSKVSGLDKLSDTPLANVPDGIPFKDTVPFGRAMIAAAPDRVLWGSDWPHGNTFDIGTVPNDGALLDLLAEIAGDQNTLRRVLVDNPARLYGFK